MSSSSHQQTTQDGTHLVVTTEDLSAELQDAIEDEGSKHSKFNIFHRSRRNSGSPQRRPSLEVSGASARPASPSSGTTPTSTDGPNAKRRPSGDENASAHKDSSFGSKLRNAFWKPQAEAAHSPSTNIITIEEFPDLPLRFEPPLPEENAILTRDLAAKLRAKMLSKYRVNNIWSLLYKLSVNGSSFQSMYNRVAKQGPTLWLFRSTNVPGLLIGAFVSDSVKKPGWTTREGEYYYGNGEGFMFEVVRGTGELRVCETTMRNAHYFASLPDAIIFGGSGGDPYAALPAPGAPIVKAGQGIALQLSNEFMHAWSEGSCPTYDLQGIPLGCGRDANGKPTGVLDNGDRGLAFQFSVADVEIYGLRFGRENGTSPVLVGTNYL